MVRKRAPLDRIESVMRKKRNIIPVSETSPVPSEKGRDLLNDQISNLYKKDILTVNNKVPKIQRISNDFYNKQQADQTAENLNRPQNIESFKTPNKTNRNSENKKNSALSFKHSTLSFKDIGGLDECLMKVCDTFTHLKIPEIFTLFGAQPDKGLLLHGPPGCGKTLLAQAIAGQLKLPYIEVAAIELLSGISGESENKIRDMFDEAVKGAPCILFIDDIDAVIGKQDTAERGMESRMINQLKRSFDKLNGNDVSSHVMVIGATSKPEFIDLTLRCAGRFETEIDIGIPNETARLKILQILSKKLKFAPNFDMQWLALNTPSYVGADLRAIIKEAFKVGARRLCKKFRNNSCVQTKMDNSLNKNILPKIDSSSELEFAIIWFDSDLKIPVEEIANFSLEQQDFEVAIQAYTPLCKKEGFATVPDVTWNDVGTLEDIKEELQVAILCPVKHRKFCENSGYSSSKGILLHGPKGCGKTLLAKAIANECCINFLYVNGPEFHNKFLGESERAVRQCFQRARNCAPCVIFFDELDAICPPRSGSSVNAAADRVVNQLLTEMDGMQERKEVFIIGATNRVDKIDSAMLRPGRLEKLLYVGLPSPEGRTEILKRITKNKTHPKISDDVDLEAIALDPRSKNYSGADLVHLVHEACSKVMREMMKSDNPSLEEFEQIQMTHFEHALNTVKPSITAKERKYFESTRVHWS